MASRVHRESPTTGTPSLSLVAIGARLSFGFLSLLLALMVIAQSRTIAYVDETTGRETIVACGSMLAPIAVPNDVPLEHARECDPRSAMNGLYAVGFAMIGGIAVRNGLSDIRAAQARPR
jgi:hypothetical protein